jgi:hypothetical protein
MDTSTSYRTAEQTPEPKGSTIALGRGRRVLAYCDERRDTTPICYRVLCRIYEWRVNAHRTAEQTPNQGGGRCEGVLRTAIGDGMRFLMSYRVLCWR